LLNSASTFSLFLTKKNDLSTSAGFGGPFRDFFPPFRRHPLSPRLAALAAKLDRSGVLPVIRWEPSSISPVAIPYAATGLSLFGAASVDRR